MRARAWDRYRAVNRLGGDRAPAMRELMRQDERYHELLRSATGKGYCTTATGPEANAQDLAAYRYSEAVRILRCRGITTWPARQWVKEQHPDVAPGLDGLPFTTRDGEVIS